MKRACCSMKAAVFREYNKDPTKIVKIEDIDVPKIKSFEVLIKVESAAYNYNDLWAIWGEPVKTPLPHISGSDVAGTVVETGEDVTRLRTGDRVVSHSNIDRKSTRLNSSHANISYAVFCLKKKTQLMPYKPQKSLIN